MTKQARRGREAQSEPFFEPVLNLPLFENLPCWHPLVGSQHRSKIRSSTLVGFKKLLPFFRFLVHKSGGAGFRRNGNSTLFGHDSNGFWKSHPFDFHHKCKDIPSFVAPKA